MLSPEELLSPRYKVIADYPKSLYRVGEIIRAGGTTEDLIYCDREGPRCRDYPHLFKPLAWWEERATMDMPKYVKCVKTPDQRIMPGWVMEVKWMDAGWGICGDHTVLPYTDCFLPATSTEYLTYKSKNNG